MKKELRSNTKNGLTALAKKFKQTKTCRKHTVVSDEKMKYCKAKMKFEMLIKTKKQNP